MTSRGHRLLDSIASAKNLLKDSEFKNLKFDEVSDTKNDRKQPLSKLNALLGKTVNASPRPSLFHRQGVAQRPTYDTISKPLTGGEEYDNPFLRQSNQDNEANLISQRLNDMRKRRLHAIGGDGLELSNNVVGQDQFGTPLWMEVLNEQRSTATEKLRSIDFTQGPEFQGEVKQFKWPRKLQWSENHSFRQWFTSKENEKATRLIEGVIDSPSEMVNPLTIVGGEQSGTTFLLRATGQAMLRRQEGHVLWFNALDLEHVSHTPIQDALHGCSTLIVDDVEQFAHHEIWKINMGEWFEYALQSSIQIITSSKQTIQDLPSSKMRRFLLDGIETFIPTPSTSTLMQFGRWYAQQRNIIIEEEELVDLVHSSQKSWRSIRNMLEEFVHLQKQPTKISEGIQPQFEKDIPEISNQIISKAIDIVHTDIDVGGVELYTELQNLGEDDYEPPKFEDIVSKEVPLEKIQDDTSSLIQKIIPTLPSLMNVKEEDKFIVSKDKFENSEDIFTTADMLVDIDDRIEEAFGQRSNAMYDDAMLSKIGSSMEELNSRIQDADIEELIRIADELQVIDEQLQSIHETSPLLSQLDSFEPEGEWFLDEHEVGVDELQQSHQMNSKEKVHLSTLKKKTILQPTVLGEEE